MARKKQLRFTADPDTEKLIEKYQGKYPDTTLSKLINLMLRMVK